MWALLTAGQQLFLGIVATIPSVDTLSWLGASIRPMTTTNHLEAARNLGRQAAYDAASWAADGNASQESIRRTLALMEDGDPEVWDLLPEQPNLSGEWADDPTPVSIAREVLGDGETFDGELLYAICDAWEEGVSEVFESACEAELRAWLSEPYCPWCSDGLDAPPSECCGLSGCKPEAR